MAYRQFQVGDRVDTGRAGTGEVVRVTRDGSYLVRHDGAPSTSPDAHYWYRHSSLTLLTD